MAVLDIPSWLSEKERVVLGAFYTPQSIVRLIRSLVECYLRGQKVVVLDPAGGCGAFIEVFKDMDYRVGDIDPSALSFLRKHFDPDRVFEVDALSGVERSTYRIPEDAFLIIVGNPPYNDWTSLYKKGQKGFFKIHPDVFDRDLGIAFLKAINRLNPDVVSILHPLSYLIKKANFERLANFLNNYRLVEGYLFPSYWFKHTSKHTAFPVLVSLYEKGKMTYEDILKFEFKVLPDNKVFRLSDYRTTDGIIHKYPIKKESSLGLYFHTFRDLNSLLRNRDFLGRQTELTIPIEPETLPYYSYLICLKHFVREIGAKNFWLFGNLSPLIDIDFFERHKNAFVWCAYRRSKDFQKLVPPEVLKKLYKETATDELVKRHLEELYGIKRS